MLAPGTQHAAAKLLQSCPTLCDPIDGSPPGSPIPGILQARTLEWLAISFSNAWKWNVKVKLLSCVRLLATPWSAAYQAPASMGFSRQEYWSGVPLPSLGTQHSDSIFLYISKLSPWLSLVVICHHTKSYIVIEYNPPLYISYLWLIYFVTASLYLLISLTYFSLPHPTLLWQPPVCSQYLWLFLFNYVCSYVLFLRFHV